MCNINGNNIININVMKVILMVLMCVCVCVYNNIIVY